MSTTTAARLAGVLYLIVAISGGFAQLYARASVRVAGDAAATADRIRESAPLFQFGMVADVVNIVAFLGVAILLYVVLSPVHRRVSGTFVILVAIAVAIMGIDLVNHAGALVVATDPSFAAAMGAGAADSLSALFLNLHSYGWLFAEVFFGLWLLPLGYVVYRSGYFPRLLGVLLMIGSASYLASFGLNITSPGLESDLSFVFALPAAIAEISFLLWLLVRGAKVEPRDQPQTVSGQPSLAAGVAR